MTNRRSILKSLAAGAVVFPVVGRLSAQDRSVQAPGLTPAKGAAPAGVWAFLNAAKAAVHSGPEALAEVFRGADSDFHGTSVAESVWSEASPVMMVGESVQMTTPSVATIDAEIGRFHTVGGWQGTPVWIVLERRGTGASEVWKPVLFRTATVRRGLDFSKRINRSQFLPAV